MEKVSARRLWLGIVAFLVCSAAVPQVASAETILQDERLRLDAGALARAGAGAAFYSDDSTADYGTFLQNARLKLAGQYSDYVRMGVQYEAASGNAGLLDGYGEMLAADPIFVRIGRFKMPVSQEALIGGGNLPFMSQTGSRTLLNQFVPVRRVGTEVYGRFDAGPVTIQPEVGLFQPALGTFAEPEGQWAMGRLLVSSELGLDVHVGYAGHVFEPNRLEPDHPNNPGTDPLRVVEYDDPLDVAFTYDENRLDLHLEGLTVLSPPTDDSVFGGYFHGGYRFGPEGGIQPKPMVGYDIVETGNLTQRISAGLNVHWWNAPVYSTLNYRFQTSDAGGTPDRHGLFLGLTANI